MSELTYSVTLIRPIKSMDFSFIYKKVREYLQTYTSLDWKGEIAANSSSLGEELSRNAFRR